jgi:hypothetical protein
VSVETNTVSTDDSDIQDLLDGLDI